MRWLTALLVLVAAPMSAHAEIEPKYYAEMQAGAPEAVTVKVTEVDTSVCVLWCSKQSVTAKAVVTAVERSSSGLKVGDAITIRYTHLIPSGGWAGPRPIPVLKAGETTVAFLRPNKRLGYHPAARGYSFERVAAERVPREVPAPEPAERPVETRTARCVIDPVPGGKRLQAVTLVLDDGTSWIAAYRPHARFWPFADKRVVFTGRPYSNPPHVQSVGGTHVEVKTIELAPGETAYAPAPDRLPAPPTVGTLAELKARAGRWSRVVMPIEGGKVVFPDGALPLRVFGRTQPKAGAHTLMARYVEGNDGAAVYAASSCPGDVPRCGMDDASGPGKK